MTDRKTYAVVGVAVLVGVGLVATLVVGAVVVGVLTGGNASGTATTPGSTTATGTTTGTATTTGTGGGTATTTTGTTVTGTGEPSFSFVIDRIESCGTTCREVTATLTNDGSVPVENVRVEVALLADDEKLWEGEVTPGTLAAGESFTTTRTVDVGLGGAAAIQNNDGYVTIEAVVRWDGGSETFRTRRKVT